MNKKFDFFLLKRLFKYLKPYKLNLIVTIFIIVLVSVLNVSEPIIEGLITTRLLNDVSDIANGILGARINFEYIIRVLVTLGIIYVTKAILSCIFSFLLTNAIQNSMKDLRKAVKVKITKLPISYFDKNTFGDILSRVSNDVETISNACQQSFSQIINAVLAITFAVVMMFSINFKMALIGVSIIPLTYFASKFIVNKSQSLFVKQQKALGGLNGTIQERYTGFNEIKLYGKEEDSIEEFKKVNGELCEFGFRAQFTSGLMSPVVSLLTYLAIAFIVILGSINVLHGVIPVGNLQAFIRYIWQVNNPMSQITQLSAAIQSAFAAMGRVFEFLDEKEEVKENENPIVLKEVKGNVSFENVEFGYTKEKILIKDLNIDIKSGQMVALVGPTGAGKTTIINLLMRFYDVNKGSIKIDGVDIRDFRREDLRSMFGMVLQDTWLFNGTIKENLRYAKFDATDEEIIEAAKVANAHHFISTLNDGYNMLLNEEASNLSAGEKQLITIARVILANPSILILDEATSSVDTRLELMLQNAMKNLMNGRTSFVIAHRLSTIKNADIILVVNDGNIVEQGNHEELIAKKGFYEKLYNSQFADKEAV